MNKTAIKNFAIWARVQLIEAAKQRAYEYEITENGENKASIDTIGGRLLTSDEKKQRQQLIAEIGRKGYTQVMEEAAYTWFNRFIALRYMEVNGFLPSKVRVFTDENGAFKPEILKEAMTVEIDGLDRSVVLDLLDKQNNEELYKYLLITQCNALNQGLPYMFEKISNWTELLFPANLLRPDSVVGQMVSEIPEEDWQDAVQIIGWMYQYYNSELKDDTFALLKKNVKISKERIPAATQLFTPDWIVRYMVENSLGRLWYEGHPNFDKSQWKYYLDEAPQEPEVELQLQKIRADYANMKPEDIKVIDPCMGSGHILVYAFDVLLQIYTSCGWSERDAAKSIIENNLYGLDIDDRAGQLAYFAVMMKARKYSRRILNGETKPNVLAIQDSGFITDDFIDYVAQKDQHMKADLTLLRSSLKDAKEFGSIINMPKLNFAALYERMDIISREYAEDIFQLAFQTVTAEQLLPLVKQAEIMAQKYDIVVTNPPYRGIGDVTTKLQDFVKEHYPNSYSDLSTVFMERCVTMAKIVGYVSMINIPVWMSLASYKELREKLLLHTSIVNMLHLGRGMFGSDYGTTAFVLSTQGLLEYIAVYKKFFKKQSSVETEESKRMLFFNGTRDYNTKQELYTHLPNKIIAYWATQNFVNAFEDGKNVNDYAIVFEGLKTRDKDRFLRMWYEIADMKWKPYAKGGAFRRWYGNNDYVVNWGTNGSEVRSFKKSSGANFAHYFKPAITYTAMTMSKFTGRYIEDQIFGGGGGGITACSTNVFYLLGFVNSSVYDYIISAMKSTVNFEVGQIGKIPVLFGETEDVSRIKQIAENNVSISRKEWDDYEYSWDFKKHPLV